MYIINKTNVNDRILVEKPDSKWINKKGEQTRFTNLEAEIINRKHRYFSQSELPECDTKYYKIVGDQVIEMSEEEKNEVDHSEYIAQRIVDLKWIYPNKKCRVTVPFAFMNNGGKVFINEMLIKENNQFYKYDKKEGLGCQYLDEVDPTAAEFLETQKSTYPEINVEYLDSIKIIVK